jgi:anti-sigma factor (TIGR02949 family)
MNCTEAGKYLYAFADGELTTSENLEVLEHLKMCPGCCQRATAQQSLKAAIARVMGAAGAPAGLRPSLRDRFAAEDGTGSHPPGFVLRRAWGGLAVAAAIALAMTGLWQWGSPASAGITDTRPVAMGLADSVLALHTKYAALGPARHDPRLPHDPQSAAAAITQQMGAPMLRCTDMPGIGGSFESAAYCELVDTRGVKHRGGHLIYRCRAGNAVSLISVSHLPEMSTLHTRRLGRREYAILRPSAASDATPMTVLIWDCPKATHIVCTPVTPAQAVDLATPLKLATRSPSLEQTKILAFASH